MADVCCSLCVVSCPLCRLSHDVRYVSFGVCVCRVQCAVCCAARCVLCVVWFMIGVDC